MNLHTQCIEMCCLLTDVCTKPTYLFCVSVPFSCQSRIKASPVCVSVLCNSGRCHSSLLLLEYFMFFLARNKSENTGEHTSCTQTTHQPTQERESNHLMDNRRVQYECLCPTFLADTFLGISFCRFVFVPLPACCVDSVALSASKIELR